MKSIFMVEGNYGEYEDRQDWIVEAFFDAPRAQALCDQLNKWCVENKVSTETPATERQYTAIKWNCPYDKNFATNYTGTQYWVATIPVKETADP